MNLRAVETILYGIIMVDAIFVKMNMSNTIECSIPWTLGKMMHHEDPLV